MANGNPIPKNPTTWLKRRTILLMHLSQLALAEDIFQIIPRSRINVLPFSLFTLLIIPPTKSLINFCRSGIDVAWVKGSQQLTINWRVAVDPSGGLDKVL